MKDPITAEDFRTVDDIVEAPLPNAFEEIQEFESTRVISNTKLYIVIGILCLCFALIVIVAIVLSQLEDIPQRYGPSSADARFFQNYNNYNQNLKNLDDTNSNDTVTTDQL